MADLQACYFCGTADGVAEYDAVPAALDRETDSQRSVALCEGCREKLVTVLEPVVAAAGSAGPAGDDSARASADATADRDGEATADAASDRDGGTIGGPAASPAGERGAGDGTPDDGGERPGDTAEGDSHLPGAGSETDATGEPGDDTDTDATGEPDTDATGEPGNGAPAYGKVLRLLRNREFPVERAAAETLATGAYDLTRREASEALDRAVAEGELIEDDGRLRRP